MISNCALHMDLMNYATKSNKTNKTKKKMKLKIDELFQHIQNITTDSENELDDNQPFIFIAKGEDDDKCYLIMPEEPQLIKELFKTFSLAIFVSEKFEYFQAIHEGLDEALGVVNGYDDSLN